MGHLWPFLISCNKRPNGDLPAHRTKHRDRWVDISSTSVGDLAAPAWSMPLGRDCPFYSGDRCAKLGRPKAAAKMQLLTYCVSRRQERPMNLPLMGPP